MQHNNGYWYELLALSTLQVVYPLEFCNLKLSDKPDLIDFDAKLGIEVVRPVDETHEMLNSYYHNHLFGKKIDQIPQEGLKKFKAHSYDVIFDPQEKIVSAYKCPYRQFDLKYIFDAIDKKMKKLNNNLYGCSDNIHLFLEMAMYSNELANYSTAMAVLTYFKKIEQNYSKTFKTIFLDCIMKLYRINILKAEIIEVDTFDLTNSIEQKLASNKIKDGRLL